tara:strand:+ start:7671 stop:8624 length:954 start_codon:yes stop_codon:yes gene_type:complete
MSSYRDVNYSIRPGKSTERKLLVSLIRELCEGHSADYNYIGFGSTYFTDFKLFHKELHIPKLITIEKDRHIKERVEFNRPFNCIEIIMDESTNALKKISNWDQKYITWLDYDDTLTSYMFNDIDVVFKRLVASSIFLITCNSILRDENNKQFTKNSFRQKFGTMTPIELTNKDFASTNSPSTIRELFISKINDVLNIKNRALSDNDKLLFRPIFFFTYADGAPMVTIGGFLDKKNNQVDFQNHSIAKFEAFLSFNDDPYKINPPNITYKEYQLLNKYVPSAPNLYLKRKPIKFIPEREKKQFLELYKYLPNYMDVVS